MLTNLYLLYLIVFAIVIIYGKPIIGIFLYIFSFQFINLTNYFSAFDAYRPAFFLALLLLVVCFLKGIKTSQHRFVFSLFLLICLIFIIAIFSGDLLVIKRAGLKGDTGSAFDVLSAFTKNITLVVLTVWSIRKRADLIRLFKVIVLGSLCNGAFAIYEQFYHIPARIESDLYRSWGFQGESNEVGGIMVATIPLALYFYKNTTKRFSKIYYLMTIIILIFGTFSTVSRTALICMLFVFGFILIRDKKNLIMLVIVSIAMLGFFTFARNLYIERKTVQTSLAGKQRLESSASVRLLYWQTAFQIWLKHPLVGVGLYNWRENVEKELKIRLKTACVHNSYLQFLAETGIIGFSIFIYLLYLNYMMVSALKAYGGFYEEITLYLRAILYSWLLFSIFFSFQFTAVYWLFLSLPFSAMQAVESETEQVNKYGIKKQTQY
jgi:O-antigen ligase